MPSGNATMFRCRAVRRTTEQNMNLLQRDGTDAGQHGVHHTRCTARRAIRLRPNTICSAPAAIVIRHSIGPTEPSISLATTTSDPRPGLLDGTGDHRPLQDNAVYDGGDHTGDYRGPEAIAIPSSGNATGRRQDAGTSCRRLASIHCDAMRAPGAAARLRCLRVDLGMVTAPWGRARNTALCSPAAGDR